MAGCSIVLFTRDLRVHDNPALHAAADDLVVPLFVHDEKMHFPQASPRWPFLRESLSDLDGQLRQRGAGLFQSTGSVVREVVEMARRTGAHRVHVAADSSAYAGTRQRALQAALSESNRELVVHDRSVTVLAPGDLTPSNRDHYAVFTPYFRRWAQQPIRAPLRAPDVLRTPESAPALPSPEPVPSGRHTAMPGGEHAARDRLASWMGHLESYASRSDIPARDATSRLSPYLHLGCISATEVVDKSRSAAGDATQFIRQLAWRDFHHQVLAARPDASIRDYRDRRDAWRRDDEELEAWKQGRTGYPIVDAGMRQLAAEGWMHNRARLIVASFLTKTLYMDWRLGAGHFARHLVDADIANNELNWQWVAGTGTDTRPNRVLNPLAQARRYDTDGDYVRRFVPELAHVEGPAIHEPWKIAGLAYPPPLVDLNEARMRFLAARKR